MNEVENLEELLEEGPPDYVDGHDEVPSPQSFPGRCEGRPVAPVQASPEDRAPSRHDRVHEVLHEEDELHLRRELRTLVPAEEQEQE